MSWTHCTYTAEAGARAELVGVAASQNKSYKLGAARVNIKDEEVSLLGRHTRTRTRPEEASACCTYTAEAGARAELVSWISKSK